jgi:hypothetical protein
MGFLLLMIHSFIHSFITMGGFLLLIDCFITMGEFLLLIDCFITMGGFSFLFIDSSSPWVFVCMFVNYNGRHGLFSNGLIPLCPDLYMLYIYIYIYIYTIYVLFYFIVLYLTLFVCFFLAEQLFYYVFRQHLYFYSPGPPLPLLPFCFLHGPFSSLLVLATTTTLSFLIASS